MVLSVHTLVLMFTCLCVYLNDNSLYVIKVDKYVQCVFVVGMHVCLRSYCEH